jgi:photosystem II stability/assembly factor-like uncharacterized protein
VTTPNPHAVHSRKPEKDRAVWFSQNVSFPMRDATPAELEKFWASQIQADISREHQWECIGPYNIAGRVTSLVIHPHNLKKWFAGSATGGLWMSPDQGVSWHPTWSRFANQHIGALTWIVFNGALTLLAATGEANMSGDSYPGGGIYASTDEGLTWQPFYRAPFGQEPSSNDNLRLFPRRIGSLAFKHPYMAVGSVFLDDSLPAGLYLDSNDGQGLKACEFWGRRSYNCHCVLFHPHERHTLFASIEPDGAHNGIWRSTNCGKDWEHLTHGLPSGDQFRRTSLAFAPSDPDVMYALAADRRNHVLGVFRSTNGGKSWREKLDGRYPTERQMSYNNTIAVHPHRPDSMVWGGMKLYRTDDGGSTWCRITNTERGTKDYVHADHHALLWPEDNLIISGNDGGVSVTHDGGSIWQERSHGMVTTMFYNLDVAASDGTIFGGGTQDNGTLIAGVAACKTGEMFPAISGDGAWIVFDPADAGTVSACASGFLVYHHRGGDPWQQDSWRLVKPRQISDEEIQQRAFPVLAIEPSTRPGVKTVWAGSNRLWRTDDNGQHWTAVSGSFDGTPISAIEIAPTRPHLMFVGTTGGGIFRSENGGSNWTQNLSCIDIPARAITDIEIHPCHSETVVVTVASSGSLSSGVDLSTGEDLPYSHVFCSKDAGNTWEDIDGGQLPNVVYYAAAYQTHPPYHLFVAGDVGVWAYVQDTWININGNLPNVVVSDLAFHHQDRTLTAATYGRGIWRMRLANLHIPEPAKGPLPEQIPIAACLRVHPGVAAPAPITPLDAAVIDHPLRKTTATVTPVPGALGYQLEFAPVESFSIGSSSTSPQIEFQSPDYRGGKWRVWAILPDGLRSAASPWRSVTYSQ